MITSSKRLSELCAERRVSLKSVCDSAGLPYGTIYRKVKEGRDLDMAQVSVLCDNLKVPVSYFDPRRASVDIEGAREAASQVRRADMAAIDSGLVVTTDMVLDWLATENYTLRNFDLIREKIDLFHPVSPDDDMIRPAHIGRRSLATIFFDLKSIEDYWDKVTRFDRETRQRIVTDYHMAQSKSTYSVADVDITVAVDGSDVSGRYRRIIAPVKGEDGNSYNLVFARLIKAFAPRLDVKKKRDPLR